jgi:hypothetical protein
MKFWFTKKTPKDLYDGKAPYDATVEQVLRVAREVNAEPADAEREAFDFAKALHADVQQDTTVAPATLPAAPALARPTVSRAAREEIERRVASYRAFQMKLNDEREARIRRTMDEVRAKLKQSASDTTLR